jgi:hypothetical protein
MELPLFGEGRWQWSQTDLNAIYVQHGGSLPPGYGTAPNVIMNLHPLGVFHHDINLSAIVQLLRLEKRLVLLLRLDESLFERVGVCDERQ